MTPGSVRSLAATVTSISPDTPVLVCRVWASRSAGRLWGMSFWMSETTRVWLSTTNPTAATTTAIPSTRAGRSVASRSATRGAAASPRRAALQARGAPARASRSRARRPVGASRSRAPRPAGDRSSAAPRAEAPSACASGWSLPPPPGGRARSVIAAKPAVSAQAKARTIPITSRAPNPRTIGIGDSSSTRKPAAVARPAAAMVGAPSAAARGAACSGEAPSRRDSSKRDWNWIA